jgi:hypothetical protein
MAVWQMTCLMHVCDNDVLVKDVCHKLMRFRCQADEAYTHVSLCVCERSMTT